MEGASPFGQKGAVRQGNYSDLVPYVVEYINLLRPLIERHKRLMSAKGSPSEVPPVPPLPLHDFFRSQIQIKFVDPNKLPSSEA